MNLRTQPCFTLLWLGFFTLSFYLSAIASEDDASKPPAALPLAQAAKKLATTVFGQQGFHGCIVTAESIGSNPPSIAINGNAPFDQIPPNELVFEIGSITKVFTALLLAQAVVEGKATLDTTITRCLGIQQEFSDPLVAQITLKQLATHTSGLPRLPPNLSQGIDPKNPYQHMDKEKLCEALKQVKLSSEGPHPIAYSNFGYGLLGEILACLYGKTWNVLVHEKIIAPLGLKNTAVALNEDQLKRFAPPFQGTKAAHPWELSAMAGAGALRSTADDLLIFGRALLHPKNTALQQAIELLTQPHDPEGKIGLGIFIGKVEQQTILEHNGGTGGYTSSLRLSPQRDLVQVVLCNNNRISPEQIFALSRNDKQTSSHLMEVEQQKSDTGIDRYGEGK